MTKVFLCVRIDIGVDPAGGPAHGGVPVALGPNNNSNDNNNNNNNNNTNPGGTTNPQGEELYTLETEITELQRENARVESQVLRLRSDIIAMENQLKHGEKVGKRGILLYPVTITMTLTLFFPFPGN